MGGAKSKGPKLGLYCAAVEDRGSEAQVCAECKEREPAGQALLCAVCQRSRADGGRFAFDDMQISTASPFRESTRDECDSLESQSSPRSCKGRVHLCLRPDCTRPTYNGQPNEFCSPKCRASLQEPERPICIAEGCTRPTWNGRVGECCSRECKRKVRASREAAKEASAEVVSPGSEAPAGSKIRSLSDSTVLNDPAPGPPVCSRLGCRKPTWNSKPSEYCSKQCRLASGAHASSVPRCIRPGCNKPTFNGLPKEFCSKQCKELYRPGAQAPTRPICLRPGCGKPTWNGHPHEYCSKICRSQWASPAGSPYGGWAFDRAYSPGGASRYTSVSTGSPYSGSPYGGGPSNRTFGGYSGGYSGAGY